MSIFQQLLGIPQQTGGVLGQVMQGQPQQSLMPQQQTMQQKPKFWQTPEFGATLSRLGANLAAASTQNEGFLDSLSLATAQTQKDTEAARAQSMQNQLIQAQIQKAQADAQPAGAFGGTGYQNQILASRYQFHVANGDSDLIARQKAINDFYALNPVTGVDAEGRPIVTQRAALPVGEGAQGQIMQQPLPQTMPQGDAISQTAQSLGLPAGTLLPPPSGGQTQGSIPSQGVLPAPAIGVPQLGGPKTQQALTEAAGKAQIDVQKEGQLGAAKSMTERQSEFKTQAAQLPMLIDVVGKLNNLADKASFTVGQRATDALFTGGLGIPTTGDTARQEYVSTVRNVVLPLLRSTFGSAFTAKEGESLLETLGNPNSTPDAKKATLNAFIEQKVRNLQTSAKEAGVELPENFAQPQPKVLKFNPATGRLE